MKSLLSDGVNFDLHLMLAQLYVLRTRSLIQMITFCLLISKPVNSLLLYDAIWPQRSWSTLVQIMVCYLTAPNHCLIPYRLNQIPWSLLLWFLFQNSNIFNKKAFEILFAKCWPFCPGLNVSPTALLSSRALQRMVSNLMDHKIWIYLSLKKI